MNFYNNKASLLNTFELPVYTTDMTRNLYTIVEKIYKRKLAQGHELSKGTLKYLSLI